jgi:hypothetical protein
VLNYLFVARVLPDLERLKPVPALAALINAQGKPGYPQVGFCNMTLPSLVYYTDRAITPLDGTPHAKQFLADYSDPWVLMGDPEWAELNATVPNLCVVDRRPIFDTRVSDIISGTAPKDLVLVKKCK